MNYFVWLLLLSLLISGCAVKRTAETSVPPSEAEGIVSVPGEINLWAFLPIVNVRKSNQPSAEKLTKLTDGDSITVLGNLDGWYHIRTDDKMEGWVRSDLLGPKNLSTFKRAVSFVDSLRDKAGIKLFFDKNLFHKRIYIVFPASYYQTQSRVEQETRILLATYHEQVYRGEVTARVLKPNSEDEYLTLGAPGEINADPLLPMVPFGVIQEAQRSFTSGIALTYHVPREISDQQLLKTARTLTASYPLTYNKIKISFVSHGVNGEDRCRLWFLEDQYGEEYRFNDCP